MYSSPWLSPVHCLSNVRAYAERAPFLVPHVYSWSGVKINLCIFNICLDSCAFGSSPIAVLQFCCIAVFLSIHTPASKSPSLLSSPPLHFSSPLSSPLLSPLLHLSSLLPLLLSFPSFTPLPPSLHPLLSFLLDSSPSLSLSPPSYLVQVRCVGQHLLQRSHRERLLQDEAADRQVRRHILGDKKTQNSRVYRNLWMTQTRVQEALSSFCVLGNGSKWHFSTCCSSQSSDLHLHLVI